MSWIPRAPPPHVRVVDATLLESLSELLLQTRAMQVREQCKLLGNAFGYLIQISLGIVAFGSLLVKKYNDKQYRTWPIWFRDTSKQGFGSLVAHAWNMLFAVLLQSNQDDDPCVYYLVNFVVDALFGCILNLALLWALEHVARRCGWTTLMYSGDYGERVAKRPVHDDIPDGVPPASISVSASSSSAAAAAASSSAVPTASPTPSSDTTDSYVTPPGVWRVWGIQLASWIIIITAAKFLLLGVIIIPLKSPLYKAFSWMMSVFFPYPKLELAMVMVVIPLILNVIVFWIQDNYLMRHGKPAASSVTSSTAEDAQPLHERRVDALSSSDVVALSTNAAKNAEPHDFSKDNKHTYQQIA